MENTLKSEKSVKIGISRLIIEHHEKHFRSTLPPLNRFDEAKKQSHATVPLKANCV